MLSSTWYLHGYLRPPLSYFIEQHKVPTLTLLILIFKSERQLYCCSFFMNVISPMSSFLTTCILKMRTCYTQNLKEERNEGDWGNRENEFILEREIWGLGAGNFTLCKIKTTTCPDPPQLNIENVMDLYRNFELKQMSLNMTVSLDKKWNRWEF